MPERASTTAAEARPSRPPHDHRPHPSQPEPTQPAHRWIRAPPGLSGPNPPITSSDRPSQSASGITSPYTPTPTPGRPSRPTAVPAALPPASTEQTAHSPGHCPATPATPRHSRLTRGIFIGCSASAARTRPSCPAHLSATLLAINGHDRTPRAPGHSRSQHVASSRPAHGSDAHPGIPIRMAVGGGAAVTRPSRVAHGHHGGRAASPWIARPWQRRPVDPVRCLAIAGATHQTGRSRTGASAPFALLRAPARNPMVMHRNQ